MSKIPEIIAFSVIEDDKGDFYIVESINTQSKNVKIKLLSDYVYNSSKLETDTEEFNELFLKQIERSKSHNTFNKMKHLEFQGYRVEYL